MRVFVADDVNEDRLAPLIEGGIEVVKETGLSPDELAVRLPGFDGVIVRSATKITAAIMDAAPSVKVVGRAGVGVDNIDISAATARGVIVVNAPDGNTITTAEHTFALLVSLSRNIPQAHSLLQSGTWDKKRFTGVELNGKTLGIIGLGRIGQHVAKIANGFGMKICGYDPFVSEDQAKELGIRLESLDNVLAGSDFISIHTPVTDETRGIIGAAAFEQMKDGVRIVNCARGGLVDEDALLNAIESGKVAGAALDVFESEPVGADSALLNNPRIITTPHLGASTKEAQEGVAQTVAEQIRDFLLSGEVRNSVNAPSMTATELEVMQPFIDLAGSLGTFHEQSIGDSSISQIEIEFSGQLAEVDGAPVTRAFLAALLKRMSARANVVNALAIAEERGIEVSTVYKTGGKSAEGDIKTTVTCSEGVHEASGSVFGDGVGRITKIGEFALEVVPSGNLLITKNQDVPGAIGEIGSMLGKHGINVSGFHLGRNKKGGEALAVIELDSSLDADVLRDLVLLGPVTAARQVTLG